MGRTSLHRACAFGEPSIVTLLLDNGANLNEQCLVKNIIFNQPIKILLLFIFLLGWEYTIT